MQLECNATRAEERSVTPLFRVVSTCRGGGYIYARTEPPHPRRNSNGLYPLHRVIAENTLGRLLEPGEDVHHRDEDKSNNSPDNLEVLSKSEHARRHADSRGEIIECECGRCGKAMALKRHVYNLRLSRNSRGRVYCSRSCGAS